MTLLEAIDSNARFKLPTHTDWVNLDFDHIVFNKLELTSNDWIIEEKSISLTKRQLLNALANFEKDLEHAKYSPM